MLLLIREALLQPALASRVAFGRAILLEIATPAQLLVPDARRAASSMQHWAKVVVATMAPVLVVMVRWNRACIRAPVTTFMSCSLDDPLPEEGMLSVSTRVRPFAPTVQRLHPLPTLALALTLELHHPVAEVNVETVRAHAHATLSLSTMAISSAPHTALGGSLTLALRPFIRTRSVAVLFVLLSTTWLTV